VLFYQAPGESEFGQIAELGGVDHQILSHRHDADPSPELMKKAFGALIYTDTLESPAVSEVCRVDTAFDNTDGSIGNVDVLFTPGHTQGGISCLYTSPSEEVYLFSGDTIIPVRDQWISQIVPEHGGNATALISSVHRLGELSPDLVLCSASVGDCNAVEVDCETWSRTVAEVAARSPVGSS